MQPVDALIILVEHLGDFLGLFERDVIVGQIHVHHALVCLEELADHRRGRGRPAAHRVPRDVEHLQSAVAT